MKKQVFGMAAALFALMLALFVGAYAADASAAELSAANTAYAILYEDGTLVFQYGDTPDGRFVIETYPVNLTAVYISPPWHRQQDFIKVVSFADKISPTYTTSWFADFKNLKRMDNIQNLNTANVENMRYMFYGCSGLKTLDLSSFDTANVTSMEYMFYGCSELATLDLSSFNTANVTSMESMFYGCSGLKTLDLSSFDTANVTSMEYMFTECSGLETLDLSSFDTGNTKDMFRMFFGCSSLTALDLSSFDTNNVKYMRDMFFGCSKLKTIYASENFTTAHVSERYPQYFFGDCVELVGGNGTEYSESRTNMEYARIDTADAPGYLTYKSAPTSAVYAITAAERDTFRNLSVTLTNPDAVIMAVSYFDASGKFVSTNLQGVRANAETATSFAPVNAKTARVMLFDSDYRPMCAPFVAVV